MLCLFYGQRYGKVYKSRTENLPAEEPVKKIPSQVIDLRPYINSLPLFDLRAAANPRLNLIDGFLPR